MADDDDDDDDDDVTSPEWIAHCEHVLFLQSSADPLHNILANIEALDGEICTLGQYLESEQLRIQTIIESLVEGMGPCALPVVALLQPTADYRLPALILKMRATRRIIAHARLQVLAYPELVDHQDVPINADVDFRVRVVDLFPPSNDTDHGLDAAASDEVGRNA
jgi:hypothetical protein